MCPADATNSFSRRCEKNPIAICCDPSIANDRPMITRNTTRTTFPRNLNVLAPPAALPPITDTLDAASTRTVRSR